MFKTIKIKTKLLLAFCLIGAIAMVIGLIGYKSLNDTMAGLEEVSHKSLPSVESLLIISEAKTAMLSTEFAMLNPKMNEQEKQNQAARCAAAFSKAQEARKVYESLPHTSQELELWNKFIPLWDAWLHDHETFHSLNRLEKTDEVWEQLSNHALHVELASFERSESLLNELVELTDTLANETTEKAHTAANNAVRMLVITIIGGIILALGLGLFIAQMITKQVAQLAEAANIASSGDLTVDIKISSKDEIGELAGAFSKMVNQMRELIQQVIDKSKTVAASAQQLNASSQQTAASANETSSTMSEMSHTVEQVTSNIQDISAVSETATQHAKEGDAGIARVTRQMQSISTSVSGVSTAINGLSKKSQEINQIVELITSIADQTNLLALNAAIEAARAGEQGRGFAVVAEEVRKLAEQSASAAKEIYQLINAIQSESKVAVERMAEGSKDVENGTSIVQEVGDNFKQIIGSVQGLTQQIQEVATATEQMSAGIQNVSAATEEQTASMEEVSAAATSLSSLADDLSSLVDRFKV